MQIIRFRVPGKVIVNGSFLVLDGEMCRSVALKTYINTEASNKASCRPEITIDVQGREKVICYYNRGLLCGSDDAAACHLFKIVDAFFEVTGLVPRNQTYIRMNVEDGFFVNGTSGEKTGIGSSACILVSITYSLLKFHQEDFEESIKNGKFKRSKSIVLEGEISSRLERLSISGEVIEYIPSIVYLTHQKVYKGSSGCDVMCCLLGSIYFDKKRCVAVDGIPKYLILGSFEKSTSTREMLKTVDLGDTRWNPLRIINKRLNAENSNPKELYKEYLDVIRNISAIIVPDEQYSILTETSKYDIWGCGISGAGGNDCVWAIAGNYIDVHNYWKKVFSFTFVTEITHEGITSVE